MPLLNEAPQKTPIAAIIIIVLNLAAFAPIAELRKFTASLLTPTHKSKIANTNKKITNPKNIVSILLNLATKINALYEENITNELHFYYKNSDKKLKRGIIVHIYSPQKVATETVILPQHRVIEIAHDVLQHT